MFKTKELTLIRYFQLNCRPYLKRPYLFVYLTLACFTSLLRHYLLLSSSFPSPSIPTNLLAKSCSSMTLIILCCNRLIKGLRSWRTEAGSN